MRILSTIRSTDVDIDLRVTLCEIVFTLCKQQPGLWTTTSIRCRICHGVGVRLDGAPLAGYVLNPAARVLWRSPSCIQLELGRSAVVLDGVNPAAIRALTGQASGDESGPSTIRRPLASAVGPLAAAGFLIRPSRDAPALAVPRLAADLAALRVRHGRHAERVMATRRASVVTLRGTGRTLPVVGALLAAAGVGQVTVQAEGHAALEHAAPGGLLPDDEGFRYAAAAAAAVRRAAPECDTTSDREGRAPNLVVLSDDQPLDGDTRDSLHARGVPHLVVAGGADSGIVGPLAVLAEPAACGAWTCIAATGTGPGRRSRSSWPSVGGIPRPTTSCSRPSWAASRQPRPWPSSMASIRPPWTARWRCIRRTGWCVDAVGRPSSLSVWQPSGFVGTARHNE